uniref:Uncharacterized protein n=1 Tax=viral metagenome TaxID=1070528 RepID=A0A6M3L5L1_9ZZZZ
MKEAIHLRFDQSTGHQKLTIFIDGANCGELTMKPEEAIWFHHICARGCAVLDMSFLSSGIPIHPTPEDMDRFAIEHDRKENPL